MTSCRPTKFTSSKLLSDVEELRRNLSEAGSPLNNNETWSIQQRLQVTCGHLLVAFQEIALEKGVERDLWNFGFRTTITELQSQAKDKKKGNNEAKDVLHWFLNAASGFYLQLLNQICSINALDLVFRRKDSVYGLIGGGLSSSINVRAKDAVTKNALYLCQYCLIHLGDLSRYRHQAKQAETYYRHAVTVAPTSGHPYNQLALLEAGRGNRLTSVFLYIRAVCVPAPFPGAPSNLMQTLSKVLSNRSKDEFEKDRCEIKVGALTRMTKDEYINLFLHFHSSLFLKGNLDSAKDDLPRLCSALSMLVATTMLTRSSLVQMFAVNVFALYYFSGRFTLRGGEDNTNKKDEETLIEPKECDGALTVLEDLMVGMLAGLLLPIHTMRDAEVVLTYPALPAIRLMFEWISVEEKLSSPSLRKKQQIWPGLCALVNFLQEPLKNFDAEQYKETPLPEDWDLLEFQPMQKSISKFKYRESAARLSPEQNSLLRAKRLTNLAIKFCEEKVDGGAVIKKLPSSESDSGEGGIIKFEATSNQTPPVEEVLDLERLTLRPKQEMAPPTTSKKKEKVGILKPQGSLEKSKGVSKDSQQHPPASQVNPIPISQPHILKDHSRESDVKLLLPGEKRGICHGPGAPVGHGPSIVVSKNDTPTTVMAKPKTTRTNVALQAILKRNSNPQEAKQVTFQTPSPAASPNPSDASNESQRSQVSTPPPPLNLAHPPPTPNFNQPPPTHIGLAPGSLYSGPPASIKPTGPPLSIPSNQTLPYPMNFSQPFNRGLDHPLTNLPPNVTGTASFPKHLLNPTDLGLRSDDHSSYMRVQPKGMFGVEDSSNYFSAPNLQNISRIRPSQDRTQFPRSPGGVGSLSFDSPQSQGTNSSIFSSSQTPHNWTKPSHQPELNIGSSLSSISNFGGLFSSTRSIEPPNYALSLHQSFNSVENPLFREGTKRGNTNSTPGRATGLNPTGVNPTGLNPTGLNPTGLNPTGLNPTGLNSTGLNPTGLNPSGLNSTGLSPTGLNASVLNPVGLNSSNNLSLGNLSHSGSSFFSQSGTNTPWWNKEVGNGSRNTSFSVSHGNIRPGFSRGNNSPPAIDTSVPPPSHHGPLGVGTSQTSSFNSDGALPLEMSNTYSLFGPLGGSREPLQQSFNPSNRMLSQSNKQQQMQPQPAQSQQFPSNQSLWAGPSPLQRLLEQKFSSK